MRYLCLQNLFNLHGGWAGKQAFTKDKVYIVEEYGDDYVTFIDDLGNAHDVSETGWLKYFKQLDDLEDVDITQLMDCLTPVLIEV